MKLTIEVEMGDRWVPQFLGMLRYMERMGQVGSSRMLRFYADGDGDFRPRFTWTGAPGISPAAPLDELTWDAG